MQGVFAAETINFTGSGGTLRVEYSHIVKVAGGANPLKVAAPDMPPKLRLAGVLVYLIFESRIRIRWSYRRFLW
jgi:hypothetical protein